jgi:hypothetical protein
MHHYPINSFKGRIVHALRQAFRKYTVAGMQASV